MHGSLGHASWLLAADGRYAVDYGVVARPDQEPWIEAIRKSVPLMKIVHEPGTAAIIEDAQELLKKAEVVCFLGFGYHEENMRKHHVQDRHHLRDDSRPGECRN
jgi:hypothetical protein